MDTLLQGQTLGGQGAYSLAEEKGELRSRCGNKGSQEVSVVVGKS